ncbi:MAG: glycine cleavage T C-terminal barrel domain-containing protein [Vicinamibacterales bacterium]|jgi:folate-binding protein YgfZ
MFSLDGYRALRTEGGVVRRTDRAVLAITGKDRADWLQGLVTNDVASLAPGEARYAAYLTPQGRMITDMIVVARADRLLLDVPASLASSLRDRLDGLIFVEDVQVLDQSGALEVWTAIAPGDPSGGALADMIVGAGEPHGFHYPEISLDTFEVVRIERGIPRFLVDMDTETIPLEAGIEDRAISFTKGCYVGQEVIVRVTHRGGGRVAKKLVRWMGDGSPATVPAPGSRIFSAGRAIGRVTSAAFSPGRNAVVGLGYVHRDFVERGTEVTVVWNDAPMRVAVE